MINKRTTCTAKFFRKPRGGPEVNTPCLGGTRVDSLCWSVRSIRRTPRPVEVVCRLVFSLLRLWRFCLAALRTTIPKNNGFFRIRDAERRRICFCPDMPSGLAQPPCSTKRRFVQQRFCAGPFVISGPNVHLRTMKDMNIGEESWKRYEFAF